jgi:hypothetical protein
MTHPKKIEKEQAKRFAHKLKRKLAKKKKGLKQ